MFDVYNIHPCNTLLCIYYFTNSMLIKHPMLIPNMFTLFICFVLIFLLILGKKYKKNNKIQV